MMALGRRRIGLAAPSRGCWPIKNDRQHLDILMADIVMVYIGMADIVMAYIVMAYIVMAIRNKPGHGHGSDQF